MPSFIKDTFRQALEQTFAMARMSRRDAAVQLLLGKLAETELYTYFVPQGVEALVDIVFSHPDVTDLVYGLSAGMRLEFALSDQPARLAVIYDAVANWAFDDSPKASPIKARIGPANFYEAKMSTKDQRVDLLLSYEWLFVCVLLRADLALHTATYASIVQNTPDPTSGSTTK